MNKFMRRLFIVIGGMSSFAYGMNGDINYEKSKDSVAVIGKKEDKGFLYVFFNNCDADVYPFNSAKYEYIGIKQHNKGGKVTRQLVVKNKNNGAKENIDCINFQSIKDETFYGIKLEEKIKKLPWVECCDEQKIVDRLIVGPDGTLCFVIKTGNLCVDGKYYQTVCVGRLLARCIIYDSNNGSLEISYLSSCGKYMKFEIPSDNVFVMKGLVYVVVQKLSKLKQVEFLKDQCVCIGAIDLSVKENAKIKVDF